MGSTGQDDDLWIRRFHPARESGARLLCFPHAGGSASYYFPLSRDLSPRIEVSVVQYPGRQDRHREPYVTSVSRLAGLIADALGTADERPLAFFGHSMGAIVAFEVAQRLRDQGRQGPNWLFVSGRRAPSRSRPEQVHLADDARLEAVLRRIGGTDSRFLQDEELRSVILRTTRNDLTAIESYRWIPSPPLECAVTALTGRSDPQTTPDEASAWREHCSGSFDLRIFPGSHFFLDAFQAELQALIEEALLARAQGVAAGETA